MLGLRSQFSFAGLVALAVAVLTLAAAGVVWARQRRSGEIARNPVLTTLAIGWAGAVVAATALPRSWPPVWEGRGDLVLTPGRGGLSDWRVLFDDPNSLAAVLLVANVVLYVPLGYVATLRLGGKLWPAIGACSALAVTIELIQLGFLGRVASIDDLVLNAGGAAVGALGALAWTRRRGPWGRSHPVTPNGDEVQPDMPHLQP